jgi:hypothetical protein
MEAWPKKKMLKTDKSYLYEAKVDDFLLEEGEEKIMRAMRNLNKLWKNYGDRLILFGGASGVSIRVDKPSANHEIESYDFIRTDGGDGADNF